MLYNGTLKMFILILGELYMRKVFLITGFQNWGKTWLIKALFDKQQFRNTLHETMGHQFCVIPPSNDDLGEDRYIEKYEERTKNLTVKNIISAFCPTREENNNSRRIIEKLYSKDEVILIPIEYKWCGHAKLQIEEIAQYYAFHQNLKIQPLTQRDSDKKLEQLKKIISDSVSN